MVPVTLNANSSGASGFVATPTALTFNFQNGSVIPQTQQVVISSGTSSNPTFSVNAITSNGAPWLSVGPSSATTPTSVSVTVNPSGLAAGTYFAALVINAPGTTGLVVPIEVTVGAASTVTVMPGQLSFAYQLGTTAPAPQTLNVTASGAPVSFTATASSASCGNNWLVVSPQSSATPSTLSVQINTTSLQAGNCPGTINISAPGTSNPNISIPVTLLASSSPLLVLPTTAPTFTYQIGTAAPATQTVQVNSTSSPLNFTVAATPVSGGPAFLNVTPMTGTTPQAITLSVNQTVLASLGPNTYAENVTVTSPGAGNSPQTFTVTLVVGSNPTFTASQTAATFNYQIGQASPASQTISLTSNGAPLSYTVSTAATSCNGFLTATPASGITSFQPGQQSQIVLSVNTTGLTTPQTCTGTVTVSTGSGGPSLTIPVALNVSSTPLPIISPGAINVIAVAGSTNNITQPVSIVSTDPATALNFTATAVTNPPGATWLSVAPQTGSTPATLQLTLNPMGLPQGVYTGSVNITSTSPNVPAQTIPVTLTVAAAPIAVSPLSLSFSQAVGGTAPSSQTIQVAGLSPGATIGAAVSMLNSSGWLTASISGNTITVTANGSQLPQGTYSGVISIIAPGAANSPFYVPVTFTVGGAPIFAVNPASVNFKYQLNTALPPAQTIQIASASGTVPFNAVAVAGPGTTGGLVFITLSPASGTTPGALTVSLNPTVVATLGPGTYTNTIQLSSSPLGSTQPITVTLTITAVGPPTVTAIVNGADFLAGSVSPGEIVTIFGTNIGPSTPQGLQLTSAGLVATTLGTTSVTFNGVPAPLIYVSANQVNAIVPYQVAGLSSATVVVMNNGSPSAAFQVQVSPTAPAIFAEGQNGSGQGAILNQDLTINSPANPAARGSVIAIYGTGEGQLNPPGVTGSVTSSTGTTFPKPNAPVTVMIGGQPATVVYAGSAPGLVSGVIQVNVMVPTNIAPGNQPVALTIGGVESPGVITAAIK